MFVNNRWNLLCMKSKTHCDHKANGASISIFCTRTCIQYFNWFFHTNMNIEKMTSGGTSNCTISWYLKVEFVYYCMYFQTYLQFKAYEHIFISCYEITVLKEKHQKLHHFLQSCFVPHIIFLPFVNINFGTELRDGGVNRDCHFSEVMKCHFPVSLHTYAWQCASQNAFRIKSAKLVQLTDI